MKNYEDKTRNPVYSNGEFLQATKKTSPLFTSGFMLFCQDYSPDFCTEVFPVS
ncbi:MAG: hypothetical protein IJS40_09230 [Synergistaceae bacterium]|nr:hypothetical protein [Synergistaceae bacterium]